MSLDAERSSFLSKILADPADDTARLVFADWLEERGGREGDAERAEFIRGGVELEQLLATQSEREAPCPENGRIVVLNRQQRKLLDTHGDAWRKCPCPECGGEGWVSVRDPNRLVPRDRCKGCDGLGDLFTTRPAPLAPSFCRTVLFRRGFTDAVSCTLAEVGGEQDVQCPECLGGQIRPTRTDNYDPCPECFGRDQIRRFVPSPWATAVVNAHPVTRFVAVDRDALRGVWFANRGQDTVIEPADANWLPWRVAERLSANPVGPRNYPRFERWEWGYDSRDAANDALALALGSLVRAEVYS